MLCACVCVLFSHIFGFDIYDYDITSFQNEGPYPCFFRGMNFTYNMGVAVPDASSSGESDCMVMSLNTYNMETFCYGKVSQTEYSEINETVDGVFASSKGSGGAVALIQLICDTSNYSAACVYNSSSSFSAKYHSPHGCRGTGPGAPPPPDSGRKDGIFGYLVIGIVVGVLFFLIAIISIVAFLNSRSSKEPMISIFSRYICFVPLLIKDGVLFILSLITGKKPGYSKI